MEIVRGNSTAGVALVVVIGHFAAPHRASFACAVTGSCMHTTNPVGKFPMHLSIRAYALRIARFASVSGKGASEVTK